jgi:hypothetical protein
MAETIINKIHGTLNFGSYFRIMGVAALGLGLAYGASTAISSKPVITEPVQVAIFYAIAFLTGFFSGFLTSLITGSLTYPIYAMASRRGKVHTLKGSFSASADEP